MNICRIKAGICRTENTVVGFVSQCGLMRQPHDYFVMPDGEGTEWSIVVTRSENLERAEDILTEAWKRLAQDRAWDLYNSIA